MLDRENERERERVDEEGRQQNRDDDDHVHSCQTVVVVSVLVVAISLSTRQKLLVKCGVFRVCRGKMRVMVERVGPSWQYKLRMYILYFPSFSVDVKKCAKCKEKEEKRK